MWWYMLVIPALQRLREMTSSSRLSWVTEQVPGQSRQHSKTPSQTKTRKWNLLKLIQHLHTVTFPQSWQPGPIHQCFNPGPTRLREQHVAVNCSDESCTRSQLKGLAEAHSGGQEKGGITRGQTLKLAGSQYKKETLFLTYGPILYYTPIFKLHEMQGTVELWLLGQWVSKAPGTQPWHLKSQSSPVSPALAIKRATRKLQAGSWIHRGLQWHLPGRQNEDSLNS